MPLTKIISILLLLATLSACDNGGSPKSSECNSPAIMRDWQLSTSGHISFNSSCTYAYTNGDGLWVEMGSFKSNDGVSIIYMTSNYRQNERYKYKIDVATGIIVLTKIMPDIGK